MQSYYAIATVWALIIGAATYYFFSNSKPKAVLQRGDTAFKEFPLIQKTVLSHNSAIYQFGLPRPSHVLGLPIGQHVSLSANIGGKEVLRSYTPTSSDLYDKGYFDILIKTYPQGNISKYVSELAIGDTMKVRGPKGNFVYNHGLVESFGMVCGGTGITPMYQILRHIAADPADNTKVNLVYANVNHDDILLKKELDAIAAENDNIKIHYVLNNAPEDWTGSVGFVTKEILEKHCPPPGPNTKLLLCGPPPMISALKKASVELGYEKARPVSKLEDQVFAF